MDGGQLRRVLTRLERGNLHPEVWIKSYLGGHYRVSTEGRVWSKYSGKPLAPAVNAGTGGRTSVFLSVCKGKRKTVLIDHLVLESFVPRAHQRGWISQHVDQDRSNNKITNLRWANQRVSIAARRPSRPKVARGTSIQLVHSFGTGKA